MSPWLLACALLGGVASLFGLARPFFAASRWVERIEQVGKRLEEALKEWKADREKLQLLEIHAVRLDHLEAQVLALLRKVDRITFGVAGPVDSRDTDSEPPKGAE